MAHNLVISGTGFDNYGDEAILKCWLDSIPDTLVLSPYPEKTRFFHKDTTIEKRPSINYLWKYPFCFGKDIVSQVKDCLYVINTGGGNLNSFDKDELYFKCLIYSLAIKYKKKIIFGSQTIGPLTYFDEKFLFHFLKKLNCYIPARDIETQTLLNKYNVKTKFDYDDAFALTYPEVKKDNIFTIGINIKGSEKYYGGNEQDSLLVFSKIIYSIMDIVQIINKPVIINFIPTAKNDILLIQKLISSISINQSNVQLSICDLGSLENVISTIGKSHLNIGNRYHFNIFSIAQKIPTIGLGFSDYQNTKLKGLNNYLFSLITGEKDNFLNIITDFETLRKEFTNGIENFYISK